MQETLTQSSELISLYKGYLKNELNYSVHTQIAYLKDINQFEDYLAEINIPFDPSQTETTIIRSWLASLSKKGDKAKTIRRKAQSLRSFFRFLYKEGKIAKNPCKDIILPKIPKPLPDIIKENEIEKILDTQTSLFNEIKISGGSEEAAQKELLELLTIEIIYSLGLRRAEVAAINVNDIGRIPPELKIKGKRAKQRIVPLPEELLKRIDEWISIREKTVVSDEEGIPLLTKKGKRLSCNQIYQIIRKHLSGVSAKKKSPHALRHTFATTMLNRGAELNSVKEFLGHNSLATTQIYTHISFAEIKKTYNKAHPRSSTLKKK